MAELIYYVGTMDCGKSTLALQTDHNHASRGRSGLVFTKFDRAGESVLSSRLGLEVPAIEVSDGLNLRRFVVDRLSRGHRIDYLICDEAQFYTPEQVEEIAQIKLPDLNADSIEMASRIVAGTARSMGIEVKG